MLSVPLLNYCKAYAARVVGLAVFIVEIAANSALSAAVKFLTAWQS